MTTYRPTGWGRGYPACEKFLFQQSLRILNAFFTSENYWGLLTYLLWGPGLIRNNFEKTVRSIKHEHVSRVTRLTSIRNCRSMFGLTKMSSSSAFSVKLSRKIPSCVVGMDTHTHTHTHTHMRGQRIFTEGGGLAAGLSSADVGGTFGDQLTVWRTAGALARTVAHNTYIQTQITTDTFKCGGYNYDSNSIRFRFDGRSTAYQRSLRSPGNHADLFIYPGRSAAAHIS